MIINNKMTNNPVKKALIEKKLTLGTWIQLGHPGIAEIFANSGFDWIVADCEHTDIDIGCFYGLIRGVYGRGTVMLARVRENSTLEIRQALDAGAGGVIVPMVNSAEEAKNAVKAAKFPPDGIRGSAYFRANNWGIDAEAYAKYANSDIAVVVMIETKEAVENIEEILMVDGIDGIFIGSYDLSASYGIVGQIDHPIMKAAIAKVTEACKRKERAVGLLIIAPTEDSIKRAVDDGFTFIALGMDTIFLDHTCRSILATARNVINNR